MSDLRQRKFARTRLALARVLADALAETAFDEISVKRLSRSAEVSEATFFNYFSRKQDLMTYLAHLWMLELGWHMRAAVNESRGLAAVDKLFEEVARTCASRPRVLAEILAWIARGGSLDARLEISALEKQLAFPDHEDIGTVPIKGIDAWLAPQLEAAITQGELPENTLVPLLLATLLSILFGAPLTLLASDPARINSTYRQQLALLRAGLKSAAGGR
jgi:AcrR family transcriptional regulator